MSFRYQIGKLRIVKTVLLVIFYKFLRFMLLDILLKVVAVGPIRDFSKGVRFIGQIMGFLICE